MQSSHTLVARRGHPLRKFWKTWVLPIPVHVFLLAGGLIMVVPFLWMLSTSLSSQKDLFAFPPKWIPNPIVFENYKTVLDIMPFWRYYGNTLYVAITVTTLQLLTSSLAGFAFARLKFPGREALFMLYVATMMIPFQVTLIPNFLLMRNFGWIDSFKALIIPASFSPFSTFLLRQFFCSIPAELDDAARIDGASSFRIWWQIIMPLATPALATVGILCFLGQWNSFLWPLVVINSPEKRVLQVALASFRGEFTTHWELIMAGTSLSLIPLLVVYIIGQRWFIRGIALTGMGGR
jgi:multiple sugar transport system permease protein